LSTLSPQQRDRARETRESLQAAYSLDHQPWSKVPNGPFIPEVVSMFPDVPVIDRPGIISAWDDPKVVAAIEKTGRKNLIMAGDTVAFGPRLFSACIRVNPRKSAANY
jgi:hypothetical protein